MLCLVSHNVFAQNSLNSSGTLIQSNFGTVSVSIGEVFYMNKGSDYSISEGIQHGIVINKILTNLNIHVLVYPNPTNNFIFFKVENNNFLNLSYQLYNALGFELLNGIITGTSSYISIKQFPSSVYYLKIYRSKNEMATYKIIKSN
jgi:hypothetical protein